MTKGKIEAALERLDKLGPEEGAGDTVDAQGSTRYVGPPTLVASYSPYLVMR